MLIVFIGFLVAGVLLFVTMPFIIRFSYYIKAVAVPNERTMHNSVMPRLGGLAIFISFMLALLVISPWVREEISTLKGILIAVCVIELTGFLDDKFTLSAKWKALGQVVATIIVISSGLTISQVHIPFGEDVFFPAWVSIPLTFLWVIGVTNAINWIDGLDGLATGVSGIAFLTIIVISIITNNYPVLLLSSIMLGSLSGFFFFNFEPAKIFMGETGSAFIGFLLATLSILGVKQAVFVSFIIPIVILGVPLFDTLLAMLRRLLNNKPVYLADRGHMHHKLVDLGLSKKSTVFIIYGIASFFGLCAIILTKASESQVITVIVMLCIFLVLLASAELVGIFKEKRILRRIFPKIKQKAKINS